MISQSQAGHHDHHAGHPHAAHSHDAHSAHPHAHQSAHSHSSHASPQTLEPIFTWFHECGYCSLWQQFPTAHAVVPGIARQAFIAHAPPSRHSPQALPPCDHYPNARPRAPPPFPDV
ncbi:hypothetical protein ACFOWV_09970 [Vreelandella malpeensis]|uniref:hypothetical protein n=1 Tax=Vreelandella malpeensis TaxID=1172368 RepID=UPI00360CB45D